jgi:hypothetical protein
LGFVLGTEWQDPNKPLVILQIEEFISKQFKDEPAAVTLVTQNTEIAAVSGAG